MVDLKSFYGIVNVATLGYYIYIISSLPCAIIGKTKTSAKNSLNCNPLLKMTKPCYIFNHGSLTDLPDTASSMPNTTTSNIFINSHSLYSGKLKRCSATIVWLVKFGFSMAGSYLHHCTFM